MANEFEKIELDITEEIINIGLSKAADSLSFFLKEKVLIQLLELKINSENYSSLSFKNNLQKSYLLTTNIKGDIGGKAYLVLSESEVEKVIEVNLSDSIKNNLVEKEKMTDAILLELDNIITASVITQFANILQIKLYGDVPLLDVLEQNLLNPFLQENNKDDFKVIYFNSRFITENLDINPEFIWLMDNNFFNGVKKIVSDEKKINLLHKLNALS
ncbi:MAG TPA: hypothetical protein VK766_06400 [Cytophagaceae bacterium]|jgi:chemotaxis protein CheY-P-specific phosphatase CheC|nr:hypothetical protein [Cytophagaceae bacterium]